MEGKVGARFLFLVTVRWHVILTVLTLALMMQSSAGGERGPQRESVWYH